MSNISRRAGLQLIGGLAAFYSTGALAESLSRSYTGDVRDLQLKLMNGAPWTPIGSNSGKVIYILAAPWCPFCKILYSYINTKKPPFQFRWISSYRRDELSAQQNMTIAYFRNKQILDKIYQGGSGVRETPPEARWLASWSEGVQMQVDRLWQLTDSDARLGTPQTWIPNPTFSDWGTLVGFSPQLWPTLFAYASKAGAVGDDPSLKQFTLDVSRGASMVQPLAPSIAFAGNQEINVRAVPNERAPILFRLSSGAGFPAKQSFRDAYGKVWIGMEFNRSAGSIGWCQALELKNSNGGKFSTK